MSSNTVDPTTLGDESGRVALQRRRERRTDHVHEIPFNEEVVVTCPGCGESITVGIHGAAERSYDSCWTWDCDAYHKFERDRDAETPDETESSGTTQTTLVTDGGRVEDDEVPDQYREVADESDYRIPPGCPHCDKSARAYYLGDVGMTEDDVFVTGWVCSACETPIALYSKGKGGDFVDEHPDLDCLDNIETPRGDDSEQSELITDGGYRPPCEAVAHMDPTPPNANEYGLERRACPNCRLYFDVGAETDNVFCSGACRKRHERGELIADGGLYEKYEVRKDGEPVEDCFVLEPESDSAAREALITYAEYTDDSELATDLREWVTDLCTQGGDDGE